VDTDFLSVSNGSGDAALMHVNGTGRLSGATTIPVDTVANVPTKFIATYGTLGPDGKITAASKRDFKGHVSGSSLIIDGFLPGSVDNGNTAGQVVLIKPNTHWSNTVASFLKAIAGLATAVPGTFTSLAASTISAASAALTGALTVGGNADITGNLTITGTSRTVAQSVASATTIAPNKQVYSVTALAASLVINAPSFTAADGMSMIIRIKDNGTARALSFSSAYTNVSGLDTPTSTVAGKLLTVGAMYNSSTAKWEIQGINQSA
jgi:hypothetical protein